MRRVSAWLGAAAIVLFAAGVYAQGKDFTGKWTPDADKNPAPAAPAGGGGGGRGGGRGGGAATDMTIAMDAKTFTMTRTMGQNDVKTVYNMDGSDSTNTPPGRGGAAGTPAISNVKWDGAKLVVTTKNPNGDQVQTWYMDGADLVRETTGANGPVKTYWKKAS